MMIKLYTTHCPKCSILEKKLNNNNIKYEIIEDKDLLIELGFTTVPILEVDNNFMDFKQANEWINKNK